MPSVQGAEPASEISTSLWPRYAGAGYAVDRVLVYGTASGAFGYIRANAIPPEHTRPRPAGPPTPALWRRSPTFGQRRLNTFCRSTEHLFHRGNHTCYDFDRICSGPPRGDIMAEAPTSSSSAINSDSVPRKTPDDKSVARVLLWALKPLAICATPSRFLM
jgi:hypothetical protein